SRGHIITGSHAASTNGLSEYEPLPDVSLCAPGRRDRRGKTLEQPKEAEDRCAAAGAGRMPKMKDACGGLCFEPSGPPGTPAIDRRPNRREPFLRHFYPLSSELADGLGVRQ